MIKQTVIATTLVVGLASGAALAGNHGAAVFEKACAACHLESMSAAETDHTQDLVAPPINLLSSIILKKTGNTEIAFVAHLTDFTKQPAEDKVKAMAEALDRFGLMPPISEIDPSISDADLQAVARWLFARYDYERELQELMERHGAVAVRQLSPHGMPTDDARCKHREDPAMALVEPSGVTSAPKGAAERQSLG